MEETLSTQFNYEELISLNKFSKICRICLVEIKGSRTPLADVFFKDKRIADILSSHLIIEVKDDFLPQHICGHCSEEILKMCSIIEKCQSADALLQSYLKFMLKNEKLGICEVVIKEEEVITDIMNLEEREEMEGEVDYANTSENDGDAVIVDGWYSNIASTECKMLEVNSNDLNIERVQVAEEEERVSKSQCPTCLKYFTSTKLNQHMKVHTDNVGSRQCPTCFKYFAKQHLERHMKVHKDKPFECQVCFKIFSFKANLKRHMMVHTGERPYVCEICGKAFSQYVVLASHKKTHVSYEHINPETGVPSFTCSHCGRIFKRSAHYNIHIKKHEKNQTKVIKAEDKVSEEPIVKMHQCSVCTKSYKTKASLYTHRLQHREKSFLCNACGKRFLTRAGLVEHLTMHTGEKPHHCKFCDKSFARIVNLELHLLIHMGVKPHLCSTCGKSFTQATHLKYHILTHTGERPYECNYCGKRFALKGNLTVHVRTHTGETPYLCSICNKGFYDSSSMKKHKKGHEKLTTM